MSHYARETVNLL